MVVLSLELCSAGTQVKDELKRMMPPALHLKVQCTGVTFLFTTKILQLITTA